MEDLLEQVRDLGPGARILQADRVRSGGFGGFFTKEKVELMVEVADDTPARPAAAALPPARPTGQGDPLLALADAVSSAEDGAQPSIFARELGALGTDPTAPAASAPTPIPAQPGPGLPMPVQTVQTVQAQPAPGPTAPTGPAPAAQTPDASAPDTQVPAAPAPAAPAPAAPTPAAPALAAGPAAPADPPRSIRLDAPAPLRPLPRPAPRPAWYEALRAAGLPAVLLPDPETPDPRSALQRALALQLPTPDLPAGPGDVVVLAGAPRAAMALARAWTGRLGLATADTIAMATHRPVADGVARLATSEDAVLFRFARGAREHPSFVVLPGALDAEVDDAHRELLRALTPSSLCLVAPAWVKSTDIASWAARLGGAAALALTRPDLTSSPAAALRSGIPVAFLDEEPATVSGWLDLLLPEAE